MKLWISAILGVIGVIIGAFLRGRKAGKEAQTNEQNEQVLNDVKKSKKSTDNVANASDDDVNKRLQKYVRK